MTSHILLADISHMELSTMVTTSGLATTEQLFEAYKTHALRSQKHICTGHVWELSRTNTVAHGTTDGLDCPILKSGVHKWSIKVLKGRHHGLGVQCPRVAPLRHPGPLHKMQGGWALKEGKASHAGSPGTSEHRRNLPSIFGEGTIVSFTLDLDQGEGNLTASIDGRAPFEVFSGMRIDLFENDGFVPAVTVCATGSVEFLGFTS
jgi:hypothetical protein